MPITNEKLKDYPFLQEMYADGYFPPFLVDKCKQVLIHLCEAIEAEKPADKESLLRLTHAATHEINLLMPEFEENDSEFETGAREATGWDFRIIVKAYGFETDGEDIISNRDW